MKTKFLLVLSMVGFLSLGISQFTMAMARPVCGERVCFSNPAAINTCLTMYSNGNGPCNYYNAAYNCCFV